MGGGTDYDSYFAGRIDIRNNVVYNFGGRVNDGGAHEVNFIGNLYKQGPASSLTYAFKAQVSAISPARKSLQTDLTLISTRMGFPAPSSIIAMVTRCQEFLTRTPCNMLMMARGRTRILPAGPIFRSIRRRHTKNSSANRKLFPLSSCQQTLLTLCM